MEAPIQIVASILDHLAMAQVLNLITTLGHSVQLCTLAAIVQGLVSMEMQQKPMDHCYTKAVKVALRFTRLLPQDLE